MAVKRSKGARKKKEKRAVRSQKKKKKTQQVEAPKCPTFAIDDATVQEQPDWCWAACINVAFRFRNAGSPQRQCDVASTALNNAGCCGFAASPCYSNTAAGSNPCNVGQDTGQITTLLNTKFGFAVVEDGALSAAALRSDLNNNHLVGVHIKWNSGKGHMLIVYGCAGNKFHVFDPCQGSGPLTLSELENYSDGEGKWDLSWRNL